MKNKTAADIMTRLVATLQPDTNIIDAMHILLKKKTPEAPVMASDGTLMGMLSETDCLKVLAAEAFDGRPEGKVRNYMTHPVEAIAPDTKVTAIVNRFMDNCYRRIPVTDENGRVIGQVSRRDVLLAFESMRDNPRLYGTKDKRLDLEEGGVDSAMKRARIPISRQ
jgi:CBS-domain-containing membrane protein